MTADPARDPINAEFHLPPEDWALPELDALTTRWYTGREFTVQRCATCDTRQHPPEEVCHTCGGMAFDHDVLAPTGTLHSFTIAHHPVNGALVGSVPYVIALVGLDDDPAVRVVGNVLDVSREQLRIGMPLVAQWMTRDADNGDVVHLPVWRPG